MAIAEHTEPYISNMCKWDVKYDAKTNERKALVVKDCGDNLFGGSRDEKQEQKKLRRELHGPAAT
ncbi:hypothetical protein MGG_13996 [Pyricularia oryzae 70-15]|uniref:Uncharacterized protein n=1 Tax=Pyricularia oryzae (strain 70-15 / ATCC MYA-4617 / FGSC 8958) TaxID=242507 RepID=G4N5X4_PYRO7|nr:uncharacterized protein MGG_13996 [Pyricularia oryzae 70-15]EHA49750.1 hypothetical protein MGG_13996 [Pyricularia oryzae 70-15]